MTQGEGKYFPAGLKCGKVQAVDVFFKKKTGRGDFNARVVTRENGKEKSLVGCLRRVRVGQSP